MKRSHQATLAQAKVLKSWAHYEQAQSLLESAITRSPDMPGRALGLITAERIVSITVDSFGRLNSTFLVRPHMPKKTETTKLKSTSCANMLKL